jgi:alpha-galactosidase
MYLGKILLFCGLSFYAGCFAQITPPPMGWNSWNHYGTRINEDEVVKTISGLKSKGFLDAGYQYVVVDGGWRADSLSDKNELLPHPVKFSRGITPLVKLAHEKGFKFGLHVTPGKTDCSGKPVGGLFYEEVFIKQFVDWELDYIKLDCCGCVRLSDHEGFESKEAQYLYWSKELKKNIPHIVFSGSSGKMLNPSGEYSSFKNRKGKTIHYKVWDNERYPLEDIFSICRTTRDIKPYWKGKPMSILTLADINNSLARFAKNGYWNDPDMLEVGNGNLTIEMEKSHFALWCIMTAPLILGNDISKMSEAQRKIVTNPLAIQINQDVKEQGIKLTVDNKVIAPITDYKDNIVGDTEIWRKRLMDGSQAILLLNRSDIEGEVVVNPKILGLEEDVTMMEVYTGISYGALNKEFKVCLDPNSSLFLYLSKEGR